MTYPGQSFGDPGAAQRTATVTLNADVSGYSSQMGQAAQQTNMLSSSIDQLQSKLGHLHNWAGHKLISFGLRDFAALGVATADAATFQKQLGTLSATAAITGASMNGIKSGIESAFQKFPVARGDIVALVEALTNLGVTGEAQLSSLTKTFIKLGAATGESSVGLAQGLVQLSRQMGVTDAGQVGNMANSLLTVSKNAGVSASSVLNFAQAIAPLAGQAHIGEASVLGMSTAFTKVGADGFVAQNVLNSIVSDITQLTKTGSPELSKYANLLGMTVQQFKNLPGEKQVTGLFQAISKGGPQSLAFLNEMGFSTRQMSAVAAVTRAGEMQKYVDMATGSQGNQSNLNKGSDAAFNSLADHLAHVRNEFTQLGTVIGTTFLKPLDFAVRGVGGMAAGLNGLIKPISWLVASLGAFGGGLGVVGGAAMNMAGLIGAVALTRMVTRGTHVASFADGMRAQRVGGDLNKLTPRQLESMERYTAGTMTRFQRTMYEGGLGAGRLLGGGRDPLAGLNPQYRQYNEQFRARQMPRAQRQLYYQGMRYGYAVQDKASATPAELDRLQRERGHLTGEDRQIYNAGMGFARVPKGGDLTRFSTWRNLGIAAVPRAIQALNAGQAQMLRESTRPAWDRVRYRDDQPRLTMRGRFDRMVNQVADKPAIDVLGMEAARTARSTGDLMNANVNAMASQYGPLLGRMIRYGGPRLVTSVIAGASGVPLAGSMANHVRGSVPHDTTASASEELSRSWMRVGAAARHPIKGFNELMKSAGSTAVALKDLGIKASGALLGAGGSKAGNLIARGASGLWGATKAAGGFAMSFPGMIAISAGLSAYHAISSRLDKSEHAGDVEKYLNPIQKYNDALGTATANLANFGNALKQNTPGASGAAATSMKEAAYVSPGDATNAPHHATNKVFNALKGHVKKGEENEALVAALSAMPITDPKQLAAAKEDMLASGWSRARVQKALDTYMKRGGPDALSGVGKGGDVAYLGAAAANSEGNGLNWSGDAKKSKSGGQIIGAMISGIDSQRQTDAQQIGGVYAQQKALQSYERGLAPLVSQTKHGSAGERDASSKALADALSTISGGSKDKIQDYILGHDVGKGFQGQEKFVAAAIGSTKQGKQWLNAITGKNGGTIDPDQMPGVLAALGQKADAHSFKGLLERNGGALGKFAANDATIQQAGGDKQESPGYQDAAVQLLLDKAVKLGGGFEGAAATLEKFKGAIGDSSSALYKQVQAAQVLAQQEAAYRTPFQSRAQNFGNTVRSYQDASKAYDSLAPDKRGARADYLKPTKDAYEAALGEQQGYLQSMYQQAQSYGIQMKRAAEDEGIQVYRSRRNFHTQQLNAQFDFNRQELRAAADHTTQLVNQANQAAQSIYDPYARIQSKYVIDGGTLSQNLGDQNAALAKQRAQISQLHKDGLSTRSIQELDLSNPENAQQVNEMMNSVAGNPKLIAQINAQIRARVKNTKELTQNPFSLSFSQGEAEYRRQLDRAGQDYQTATHRAEQQQGIALGDMADDYNKTVRHAGEDLTTAMTEVTGQFGSMYDKTMGQIAASVEKFSPKAAAQMRKDLKGLIADFPFLKGDAAGYDPTSKPGGANNPISKAGTLGINPQGKSGYYDTKGKFHDTGTTAPYLPGAAPHIVPPPLNPPKKTASPTTTATHSTSSGGKVRVLEEGGITVGPTLALVSEWAPNAAEAHIPLNDRGANFMSEVISKALVQKMHTSGRGAVPTGTGGHYQISEDHSTNFSGDMHISAANLGDLLRQLERKQRLHRLSSPSRNGR